VQPNQVLYFGGKSEIRARVRADGAILYDGFLGSIHQVGRKITNAPCNGWEHWFYEDAQGERRPIDDCERPICSSRLWMTKPRAGAI